MFSHSVHHSAIHKRNRKASNHLEHTSTPVARDKSLSNFCTPHSSSTLLLKLLRKELCRALSQCPSLLTLGETFCRPRPAIFSRHTSGAQKVPATDGCPEEDLAARRPSSAVFHSCLATTAPLLAKLMAVGRDNRHIWQQRLRQTVARKLMTGGRAKIAGSRLRKHKCKLVRSVATFG